MTPEEVKELGEWSRKIIEVYMQWYTFFVTSNLLLMGWFNRTDKDSGNPARLVAVGRLFRVLNILGIISTATVGYYTSRYAGAYSRLIIWAAIANGLGLLGIAYVWGLVIPKSNQKTPSIRDETSTPTASPIDRDTEM